jgi:hypothetical protein
MSEGVPEAERGSGLRPLLAIAAGLIVLTAVAVAVVTIPLGSRPKQPADSPEHAFREFIGAVNSNELVTADTYLSLRLKATGESAQAGLPYTYGIGVTDVSTVRQTSTTAVLFVEYTYKDDLGFHPPVQVPIDMVLEGDNWKIDSAFWEKIRA